MPTKAREERIKEKRSDRTTYRVVPGPEGFLPPAAASMGVVLPDPGQGLVEGEVVTEEEAMEIAATKLLKARVPTLFPGPLVLWNWNKDSSEIARATKLLADVIPAKIIPMADYRPKYPRVYPEIEINPNHPNLTIWHNKIDVCLFVGVHCHQANIALKIIRGSTPCYTIAMCAFCGDDDANITIRDVTHQTMFSLAEVVLKLKKEGVGPKRN